MLGFISGGGGEVGGGGRLGGRVVFKKTHTHTKNPVNNQTLFLAGIYH